MDMDTSYWKKVDIKEFVREYFRTPYDLTFLVGSGMFLT